MIRRKSTKSRRSYHPIFSTNLAALPIISASMTARTARSWRIQPAVVKWSMEIKGEWQLCEDGIVRPVMRGRFQSAGGGWVSAELLIDTGADRTGRHRYEIIQE